MTTQQQAPVSAHAASATIRRMQRRELHRSRSLSASLALWLTALAIAVPATLVLLDRAGLAPELTRVVGEAQVASLAGTAGAIGIAIGAAAALVGLVLVVLALAPGRRQRHAIDREGIAVVADDGIIASSISRAAATGASTSTDRVRTSLGAHVAAVTVRSPSGYSADVEAARSGAERLLRTLALHGSMRVSAKEEHP